MNLKWLPKIFLCLTKATRPLRLPAAAPKCFKSQGEWDRYRKAANFSGGDGFTYCTDCTPARQAEMHKAARCQYPKTVFVSLPSGAVMGRRKK